MREPDIKNAKNGPSFPGEWKSPSRGGVMLSLCARMRSTAGMLGLLAALCVAGCRGKYVRPVSDEPIVPEAARLQRGSYLVNNVLFCGACHTSREHGKTLVEPERTDAFLGGGNLYDDKSIGLVW